MLHKDSFQSSWVMVRWPDRLLWYSYMVCNPAIFWLQTSLRLVCMYQKLQVHLQGFFVLSPFDSSLCPCVLGH